MSNQIAMNSEQLRDEYADYFFEKGDGLPSDLKHHELLGSNGKSFTLIFPTRFEQETGDITLEPFASIFAQVRNFREGEDATIKVTITTPHHFGSEEDEEKLAEILGVGDNAWHHDFYLFITFS